MKNEKMKRVAALALAGTIAVSTISPAAFADDGEPVEQNNGGSEEQQQAKTQADGAIDHVVWDKPTTEDDESKKTTGHVNPSMSENDGSDPGFTLETDGDVIKTEETTGNTTEVTVVTPKDPETQEDIPLHEEVVTPVPEEPKSDEEPPLTDEEQAVVEDAEEVEDGIEGALTEPVEEGEPENTNDKVEGALEDELEEKEEDQDLAGAQEEAIEGALNVDGDTGKGSVTVDGEKFDAEIMGTTESKPQTTTPTTGNDGNHAEEDKKKNDITNETTTIVTTTIKLTPDKLTQTKEGEEPAFTNTELSELLEMEIPEDAEWDVDSEGHRTLTLDGKTITLTQEESSLETGTGWIATITSTIKQGEGEAEIKDTVDVTEGPHYVGSSVETSDGGVLPGWDCGEWKDPDITQAEIEEAMNAVNSENNTVKINGKDYIVVKTPGTEDNYYKDTYTLTTTDENGKYVSYTIEKQPVITEENLTNILEKWGIDVSHTVTADALKDMDQNQLQEVLGSAYTKGDNGEIYYTYQDAEGNEVKQEVTFEKDATIGQYVAITVTKTNEHGAESGPQVEGMTDAYQNAKEEAEKNAAMDALEGILGKNNVPEGTEFTQNEDGSWSATVTVDGVDKTYTFEADSWTNFWENETRPSTEDEKKELAEETGKDIKWAETTTVTGHAYVDSGTVNWTDTETITGILGFEIEGSADSNYDPVTGQIKSITVTSKDKCGNKVTKVYTFTYAGSSGLTEEERKKWEDELLKGQEDSWKDNPTLGSTDGIQKVTWTVETTTTYTEKNQETKPVVTVGDIGIGDPQTGEKWVQTGILPTQQDVTTVKVNGWNGEEKKPLDLVNVNGETNKDGELVYREYTTGEWGVIEPDYDNFFFGHKAPTYTITSNDLTEKSKIEELLQEANINVTLDDENKTTVDDGQGNLLEVQYTATQTTVTKEEKDEIKLNNVGSVVDAIKAGEYTVAGYDKTGDAVTEESFKEFLKTQQQDRQAEPQTLETYKHGDNSCNPGFNPNYKPECSPSYTITKVTSKSSTKLEMTVLSKKEIDKSVCNNGITGRYEVNHEQKLDVKNCWGVPEYNGEGSASYDTYTEWLTTTDTFVAGGVQYGEVTTSEWTCEGLDVKKQNVAPVGFDYQEVTTEVKVTDKVDIAERTVDLKATIETLDNGSGSGSGTGTGTGEGDGDGSFVAEDLPLTDLAPVMMTIAETETPLAAAPAVEEETDIEDEDVALAGAPDTGDKLVDLADAQVAKSAVPKTGDESGIFLLMSMISGMALAVLSFIDRKGRHSRFGSQH